MGVAIGNLLKFIGAAALALGLLTSCATTAPSPAELAALDYGPYPDNYETVVRDYLQGQLKDPESARLRLASRPDTRWQKFFGKLYYGWRVCYFVNGKNSYGGYTGEHLYYFILRSDQVVFELAEKPEATIWDKTIQDACE